MYDRININIHVRFLFIFTWQKRHKPNLKYCDYYDEQQHQQRHTTTIACIQDVDEEAEQDGISDKFLNFWFQTKIEWKWNKEEHKKKPSWETTLNTISRLVFKKCSRKALTSNHSQYKIEKSKSMKK